MTTLNARNMALNAETKRDGSSKLGEMTLNA